MARSAAQKNAGVKALYATRRALNRCITNKRHRKAYKGGRCKPCWKTKLANDRAAYAKRKKVTKP